MKLYANLHTHSTHSDGGFTPKQLAAAAKKEGYGALALTDHDTVTGYTELREECEKLGLETIFGTEFSSPSKMLEKNKDKGAAFHLLTEFHICGYHFDPEHPKMKEYLAGMSFRETEQTRTLFERGVRLGKIHGIEWDEVLEFNKGVTWLCNDHLWRALLAKGLMKPSDREWYFRELFGVHRHEVEPAYPFLQEHEIIKLIHDAGGIAIVAHPHNQLECIEPLVEMGIDGLEVWHHLMTDEEKEKALRIAHDKGLYISGGSDHYGLCSGYYKEDGTEKNSSCYAPYLSYGTKKEYFDEIKNRQIMQR
ncbi:MAG: PHP domain-containing protein [Oscillospiraceae bacterium]|nr:PHP domain-containing protein [Oscillospiraceae bacterium]